MILREIFGENRNKTFSKIRYAARAILIENSQILLVHDLRDDVYMLPGGGLEHGETMEQCCIREVEEETGYICETISKPIQIAEYYEEYKYIDQYYICEAIGQGKIHLTENEIKSHLAVEWMSVTKCIDMFSRHKDFEAFEEKKGIYLREYTALSNSINWGNKHNANSKSALNFISEQK